MLKLIVVIVVLGIVVSAARGSEKSKGCLGVIAFGLILVAIYLFIDLLFW